jgi:hypothetical protein
MAKDPACTTLTQPTSDRDVSGKRNNDAHYYISLTIPQSAHFLSSLYVSARQLDEAAP